MMKKLLTILGVVIMVASLFAPTSFAASPAINSEDEFTVTIKGIEFVVPYNKEDVTVKESTSDAVGLVEVFDKDTGKFLQDFKVEEEKQNNENNPLADYGISDYSLKNVSSTKAEGPSNELRSTLYAKLYIYSTGSFRQINEVRDTWWTTSSGGHTLENTQSGAISTSGSWPATEVEVDGNATIEVAIDASASASFEAAGFSVGVEAGGTYYARKDIWHDFRYSVY